MPLTKKRTHKKKNLMKGDQNAFLKKKLTLRIPVHYTLEGFQKGETKLGSSFKLTLREKENVLPELRTHKLW